MSHETRSADEPRSKHPTTLVVNRIAESLATTPGHIEFYERGKRERRAFSTMLEDIRRCAAALAASGVAKGSRIGLVGSNCYDFVVCDLACVWLAATSVAFDPHAPHDLAALMRDYDLVCILSDVACYLDDENTPALPFGFWRHVQACPRKYERYAPDDILAIKFTSGSTRAPKAIGARAASVGHRIDAVQQLFQHMGDDRILVFLPLYLLQQRYWIYSAILFGFTVIVTPAALAVLAMKEAKPTVVMGVPAFFEAIANQFLAEQRRRLLSRVALALYRFTRRVAGAVISRHGYPPFQRMLGGRIRYLWTGSAATPNWVLTFYDELGIDLLQGYGLNETCIVTKNCPGANRVGSAGRPLPGMSVRIDTAGQIIVHSLEPVALSYFRADTEDSEAVFAPDGAVATGDLGRLDSDGYLWITGRKKDLIVLSSGRKVQPTKVEAAVMMNPGIEMCFVYGSEHPYIVAIVQPRHGVHDAEIERAVLAANARAAPEERILRHIVRPDAFSIQNGLLSPQYKLRRAQVACAFRADLEALYD